MSEPAPITQFADNAMPATMVALPPITTPSSIVTGDQFPPDGGYLSLVITAPFTL